MNTNSVAIRWGLEGAAVCSLDSSVRLRRIASANEMRESVYKPGSVIDDHSSGIPLTRDL